MNNVNSAQLSTTVTRPDNTDAYASGDVIGTAVSATLTFAAASLQQASLLVIGAALRLSVGAVPSGMSTFRLHLYTAAPTAIADNAAFNIPSGDRAAYLGFVELPAPLDLGDTIHAQNDDLAKLARIEDTSGRLFAVLETRGAYTPAALTIYTVTLDVLRVA
jgi:hypothetical protein